MPLWRQKIENEELGQVLEACDMVHVWWYLSLFSGTYCGCLIQALDLNEKKLKIMEYVESRMSFIAPNLSQIVGPTVAAKLMGKFCIPLCILW